MVYENQKYFLFKIKDVLNNGFHSFEIKRMESISLCLKLCVDTGKEIEGSSNADLLINAYKSILDSMKLLLKYHPFKSLECFSTDIKNIIEKIDNYISNTNNRKISDELYMGICSMYKRLQKEASVKYYVEIMINEEKLRYQEIDDLIGFMISDLLYQGYSMQYLREWYDNNIMIQEFFAAQEEMVSLEVFVLKFLELTGQKKCYKVYIKYKAGTEQQKDRANEIISKKFELLKQEEVDNIWANDTKYTNIAKGEYWTCDLYKAVRIAEKEFCQMAELYHMSVGSTNVIISSFYIYGIREEENFITKDIRKNADVALISFVDRAKKQQYDSFIELPFVEGDEDFDTLDRVLHTLYNATSYNIQNRFLNFWSSLEYLLHSFPRKSIIEKARVIVPELLSLFYIKDKMNVFWERFIYHYNKKVTKFEEGSIIVEFYNTCKSDVEGEYDTQKVINFLMNETKAKKFEEEYKGHCVIVREFRELYMLVVDVKKRNTAIVEFGDIIRSDLNIIYRMRNQLIHSGGALDDSYEYIGLRLYRYVNAILSTILFYKRKNNAITISEILFSIDETYRNYINEVNEKPSIQEVYRAVRPKYMYIE